jgi:hypothetical protein
MRRRLQVARDAGRVALALGIALSVSGCGYTLAGRGSFLPAYVKRIGIPLFGNRTSVFEIEQVLTQRIRSEFMGRGKFEIVPQEAGADAVLTGEVTSLAIAPSGFNAQQQATRYAVTLTAKVEFRDLRANAVLWADPNLVFREEYDVTTVASGTDPTLFFGQNANALERLATAFARTVVSAILEAF